MFMESFFKKGFSKVAEALTPSSRKHITKLHFVFPEERRYPIHDLAHARNALARVSQFGTTEEKNKVRTEVYKKYPALKERAMKRA